MREKPLKKNSRFYLGMVLNVVEGMLSGFNFLLLYEAMKMLWNGTINSPSLLRLSLFLGGIFILRIVIYSVGYTQSQIGGAAVIVLVVITPLNLAARKTGLKKQL